MAQNRHPTAWRQVVDLLFDFGKGRREADQGHRHDDGLLGQVLERDRQGAALLEAGEEIVIDVETGIAALGIAGFNQDLLGRRRGR